MDNALWSALAGRLDCFTVVAPVLVTLEEHIHAMRTQEVFCGLTGTQMTKGYNECARRYGKNEYNDAGTYAARRLGKNGLFSVSDQQRYMLNPRLLAGLSLGEMEAVRDAIAARLNGPSWKNQFLSRLRSLRDAPSASADKLATELRHMLSEEGTGGAVFEIISYSILRTYIEALGFSLKRFSVTSSPDGGMDFVAGEGFYQATTSASRSKVAHDLRKLPGVSRILVARHFGPTARRAFTDDVLEALDEKDLLHFLEWMCQREPDIRIRRLRRVVEVAIAELERE